MPEVDPVMTITGTKEGSNEAFDWRVKEYEGILAV